MNDSLELRHLLLFTIFSLFLYDSQIISKETRVFNNANKKPNPN
jgi:hypothetical protein